MMIRRSIANREAPSLESSHMAKLKLTFFDFHGGRGEPARLALSIGGIPFEDDRVKGMPSGYEDLTVAQIKQQSADWNRPMLEAALEYEQAHGKRKGAVAAIESALSEKESD